MTQNTAERVKYVRTQAKGFEINQNDFAKSIKISQSLLSLIEIGKKPLSEQNAWAIEKVYGYRAEWLLLGRGPQRISSDPITKDLKDKEQIWHLISKWNLKEPIRQLLTDLSPTERDTVITLIQVLVKKK